MPLGVLLHDENKLDEMTHVLDHYMQLVPKLETNSFLLLANGEKIEFDATAIVNRYIRLPMADDESVPNMNTVVCCRSTFFGITVAWIP